MTADSSFEPISSEVPKHMPLITLLSRTVGKAIILSTLIIAGLGILLGCLSLSLNSLDSYPVPLLLMLGIFLVSLFFYN